MHKIISFQPASLRQRKRAEHAANILYLIGYTRLWMNLFKKY